MINRRLLRIKALQELYAFSKSGEKNVINAEKELYHSVEKSYEQYFLLLLLSSELKTYTENKIELIKNRIIKDSTEWKNFDNLANNKAIEILLSNPSYQKYLSINKINWIEGEKVMLSAFSSFFESETYIAYSKCEKSLKKDKEILEFFYSDIIAQHEDLFDYFEDKSVYWNDDVDYIISMVIKSIRRIKANNTITSPIFDLYRDDDDKEFVKQLFRKSCVNLTAYNEIINTNLQNWELDRIPEIDILIIKLAITEMIEFSSIPVKVTINEYIDIAKFYSTEKSSIFINGILDKISKQLTAENKIKKAGRGLINS